MLTRSMRADLGVMISASHNPYDDNGIKLFGPDGYKLSGRRRAQDRKPARAGPRASKLAKSADLGRAKPHRRRAGPLYRIRQAHPAARIDRSRACASWSIAPMAPPIRSRPTRCGNWAPKSFAIGVEPNGFNINKDCGSTEPAAIVREGARGARRYRHRARRRRRPRRDRR